jgi:hypothetical protein
LTAGCAKHPEDALIEFMTDLQERTISISPADASHDRRLRTGGLNPHKARVRGK